MHQQSSSNMAARSMQATATDMQAKTKMTAQDKQEVEKCRVLFFGR